jgi:hypothetical protein
MQMRARRRFEAVAAPFVMCAAALVAVLALDVRVRTRFAMILAALLAIGATFATS